MCNKNLDYAVIASRELYICGECQAYFCDDCRTAVKDYHQCPVAGLLGTHEHELKFVKILPPEHVDLNNEQELKTKSVKILPRKTVKILETDKIEDDSKQDGN